MKNGQQYRSCLRRLALVGALTCAAVGLLAGQGWGADPSASPKMIRQIGVMEKIIDKVLIDSPNFLVGAGNNARGLYLPEFGVIFTFDASLTGGTLDFSKYITQLSDRFEMKTNENGDQVIVIKKHTEKDKEKEKAEPSEDTEKSGSKKKDVEVKEDEDSAAKYENGKGELIQVFLDYGETITELKDGQWLVIAAFLRDNDYFKENKISRLVLKARAEDVRAAASGDLSESAAKARIVVEEY